MVRQDTGVEVAETQDWLVNCAGQSGVVALCNPSSSSLEVRPGHIDQNSVDLAELPRTVKRTE